MSPQIKAVGDSVAVPTAILAWMKAITIPEVAALLAGVYTALRIGELLYSWYRKWRR
jgi:hypothetical protein